MDLQKPKIQNLSQSGFAAISLVTIAPLIMVVVISALGVFYVFNKKLTAQSLCVKSALELQRGLSRNLQQLLQLNPEAARLRRQRAMADKALQAALKSKIPKAIAAAKAAQLAVILAQTAFRVRQQSILAEAAELRGQYQRDLQLDVRRLGTAVVKGKIFYVRPLAVEPRPANSLSPDYLPVTNFKNFQQQEFSFEVELSPDFLKLKFQQKTLCSASLNKEAGRWRENIVAASALSRLR